MKDEKKMFKLTLVQLTPRIHTENFLIQWNGMRAGFAQKIA